MGEIQPGFKSPVTTTPDGTRIYSVLRDPAELGWDVVREIKRKEASERLPQLLEDMSIMPLIDESEAA